MYGDYDYDNSEYAGSYAHDVEGWSDDDIDTVFDGVPMPTGTLTN